MRPGGHLFKVVEIALIIVASATAEIHYFREGNSIQLIAEDLGVAGYNTAVNDERNKGAFVMGAESMDIERLLSRSQSLAQGKGKGGGK